MDFFTYSKKMYILLSPFVCFVTFLYLDLYLLGVESSIILGSFT